MFCAIIDLPIPFGPTSVNGGPNPRKSGAGRKIGMTFAVGVSLSLPSFDQQPTAACSHLSTPSAAEGGGRRPAFTGGWHAATLGHRIRRLATVAHLGLPVAGHARTDWC